MFKKKTIMQAWRVLSVLMVLTLPLSTTPVGVNFVYAAPGYQMGSVTSEVTGALELSISGNASAIPYVGNTGAGHQFVSIDWEPGVRNTYDITTSSQFTTIFSGSGNSKQFITSWTPIAHTYTTGGLKTVIVKVHHAGWNGNGEGDASEFQFNVFIPQASLTVIKNVVGGDLSPSDFTINVSGTNVSPASFPGSSDGTLVSLDAGAYSVSENAVENYTASYSENCSGTIVSGENKTCIVTNTFGDAPSADLSITKESEGSNVEEGTLTYLISVENLSQDTASTNIEVTDQLPAGVTYVSHIASAGTYNSGTGIWSIPEIVASSGATLSITVTIDGDTDGSEITNTAEITSSEVENPDTEGNNSDSETFTVVNRTFCGDGTQDSPNTDLTGGPNNDGYEACDGTAGAHQNCSESCELINLTYCGDGTFQAQNEEGNGGTNGTGDEECDGTDNVPGENFICSPQCILVPVDEASSICGVKYEDSNLDQSKEGEDLLSGWMIVLSKLFGEEYEEIGSSETSEEGTYCFNGLSSGFYTVHEVDQEGWFNTTDADFFSYFINLGVHEDITDIDFGNFQCTDADEDGYTDSALEELLNENEINSCGEVFDCDDANGSVNPGATEVCDEVDNNCDGQIDEGEVCGPDPFCGDGIINQESEVCDGQAGEFGAHEGCGAPDTENACQIIALTYCGDGLTQEPNDEGTGGPENDGFEDCDNGPEGSNTCTSACVEIVIVPEESISGIKFHDLNGDGELNNEEVTLANWTIHASNGEQTFAADTNESGIYGFSGLADGEWTVWEIFQDAVDGWWVNTTDATTTVELIGGQGVGNVDFGNLFCSDEDNDGYSTTGFQCGTPVDCNDENSNINPGVSEACDQIDNDCDGQIDEDNVCGESEPTPPQGGGGGGGSSITQLIIHTEQVAGASGDSVTVTLTWHTNMPANTRVVWDTQSHPVLDPAPNYGYAFSTAVADENPKVTFHTVVISGLSPETTYYFRPISAASPEVHGIELSFTTAAAGETVPPTTPEETTEETTTPTTPAGATLPTTGTVAGVSNEAETETGTVAGVEFAETNTPEVVVDEDETTPEEIDETSVTSRDCTAYVWILLILNIAALAYAAYRSKQATNKNLKNAWWILALLTIIPVMIGYASCWLVIWLLVMLVAAVILIATLNKKN